MPAVPYAAALMWSAGGLAVVRWPEFVHHEPWPLMEGVVNCMLAAVSVLAFVGLLPGRSPG